VVLLGKSGQADANVVDHVASCIAVSDLLVGLGRKCATQPAVLADKGVNWGDVGARVRALRGVLSRLVADSGGLANMLRPNGIEGHAGAAGRAAVGAKAPARRRNFA
jgi:hypothetical protein